MNRCVSVSLRLFTSSLIAISLFVFAAAEDTCRVCLMEPTRLEMQAPGQGFTFLDGEEATGPCHTVMEDEWTKMPCAEFNLLVAADGPYGSGRYWIITVGLGQKEEKTPCRGFCLETTTAGWQVLQHFSSLPLPWMSDLNADGTAELIVWESFCDEPPAFCGLMAWVYQVDQTGKFTIDWNLSRKMANELAAEYRTPLKNRSMNQPGLKELRDAYTEVLADFAGGKCKMQAEPKKKL